MPSGLLKVWEPLQIWMENVHLAEDTGFLIRDSGWVDVGGVIWREEVPTFPRQKEVIHSGVSE